MKPDPAETQTQSLARQSTGMQAVETTAIGAPASVGELRQQVNVIQDAMAAVMKVDEHYGVIPGTGSKPSLLKPGAEKLSLLFRLAPEYQISKSDLGSGHREYEITCTLRHINSNKVMGQGVGSCNTMEGKFRYRTESTGKDVPREYWDSRDKSLLGGDSYSAKKKGNQWLIFHRVDHDNPPDYYNTVLKMAKKRAHVDAILTATAASDIFTQDFEDMPEVIPQSKPVERPQAAPQQARTNDQPAPRPNTPPAQNNAPSDDKPWLNETDRSSGEVTAEWDEVVANIRSGEWTPADVYDRYKVSRAVNESMRKIKRGEVQEAQIVESDSDGLPF